MLNINENTMDAYKQKARAQIKEMKAKMQVFEAQAEKAGADMRVKYEKNLERLEVPFRRYRHEAEQALKLIQRCMGRNSNRYR